MFFLLLEAATPVRPSTLKALFSPACDLQHGNTAGLRIHSFRLIGEYSFHLLLAAVFLDDGLV
jgi:hypothetical protein